MSWTCGNELSGDNKSALSIITFLLGVPIIIFIFIFLFDNMETENGIEADSSISQGPSTYSIGGITFTIPDNYYYEDGMFLSDYSRVILTEEKIDNFWNVYPFTDATEFNDIADQQIGKSLSNSSREHSQTIYVAGNKSLLYEYSGEIDDKPITILLAMIFRPDSESCIYVIFETPNDSNIEINDFEYILDYAETTVGD